MLADERADENADDEHVGVLTRMLMNMPMTSVRMSMHTGILVCLLMVNTLLGMLMMSMLAC